jgi:hypothetical protein
VEVLTAIATLRADLAELDAAMNGMLCPADAPTGSLSGPDPRELRAATIGFREVLDAAQSRWLRLLAAVERSHAYADGPAAVAGSAAVWLRGRCRIAPRHAAADVRLATILPDLPCAAAALAEGAISTAHTRVIARAARLHKVPAEERPAIRAQIDEILTATARDVDPILLATAARHVTAYTDPDGSLADTEAAHAARWLSATATFEGTVALGGHLDPESGAIRRTALDALDAPTGGQRPPPRPHLPPTPCSP